MNIIRYYFIVVLIIGTALTVWDKCNKKKKQAAAQKKDAAEESKQAPEKRDEL